MTRVQITAMLAIILAVASTWLAHVGDTLTRPGERVTSQVAHQAPPAEPQVTRTRIITSILDPDPTVIGSITRPATPPSPAGEPRR
jgi:hypothetical protein